LALLVRRSASPVSRLFALCPRPPDGLEQYSIVKGFLEENHHSGRQRFSAGLLIFVDGDEHDGHTLAAISQHLQEFHAGHCYPATPISASWTAGLDRVPFRLLSRVRRL
jgi:hypothetical protein